MDELLVVPFTKAFSRIRAERFAEMLVAPPVGAETVVVGENFRFGHGGAGTVEMLTQFGRSRGARRGVARRPSPAPTASRSPRRASAAWSPPARWTR